MYTLAYPDFRNLLKKHIKSLFFIVNGSRNVIIKTIVTMKWKSFACFHDRNLRYVKKVIYNIFYYCVITHAAGI